MGARGGMTASKQPRRGPELKHKPVVKSPLVVRRLLGNEPVGGLEGAAEIAYGGPVLPGQ